MVVNRQTDTAAVESGSSIELVKAHEIRPRSTYLKQHKRHIFFVERIFSRVRTLKRIDELRREPSAFLRTRGAAPAVLDRRAEHRPKSETGDHAAREKHRSSGRLRAFRHEVDREIELVQRWGTHLRIFSSRVSPGSCRRENRVGVATHKRTGQLNSAHTVTVSSLELTSLVHRLTLDCSAHVECGRSQKSTSKNRITKRI